MSFSDPPPLRPSRMNVVQQIKALRTERQALLDQAKEYSRRAEEMLNAGHRKEGARLQELAKTMETGAQQKMDDINGLMQPSLF